MSLSEPCVGLTGLCVKPVLPTFRLDFQAEIAEKNNDEIDEDSYSAASGIDAFRGLV